MTYTVEFRGGSLGGQTLTFEGPPQHRLSFPVLSRIGYISESGTLPPLTPASDEYFVERTVTRTHLIYRWRRPDIEGMESTIRRLETELAECRKPPPRQGLMRFGR